MIKIENLPKRLAKVSYGERRGDVRREDLGQGKDGRRQQKGT